MPIQKSPFVSHRGERERARSPLAPVPQGGVGERSAPRPVSSETTSTKEQACFVGNQNLHQNSPGRAREGVNPLDFQSRPATCAAERLLAQRASKSLRDRPSEIEDFGWSPPGADFFGVGLVPPEKKSLPCRFRARKSKGFQRNLRKGGAEGNLSPPPPGELERAAALSNFQSKRFPQEIVSASHRGWQWRGSKLPRHMSVSEFSSPSHSSRTAPRSGGRSSGACRRAAFC